MSSLNYFLTVKFKKGGVIMAHKPRNWYKYKFKVGNKIVHRGITEDLERREQEHRQRWPKGHIVQVGKRTTEDAARKWEEEHGCAQNTIYEGMRNGDGFILFNIDT